MIKLFLILLLTSLSSIANAEWTNVGSGGNGEVTIYANISSIRKVGNKVKMWDIFDYRTEKIQESSGLKYLSVKSLNEYDCAAETSLSIYYRYSSGNMGLGKSIYTKDEPSNKSYPVVPDSLDEKMWKVACDEKFRQNFLAPP
jgi:hypothetical protein